MKRRQIVDERPDSGPPAAKKSKTTSSTGSTQHALRDDDGNIFWELPKSRRVTVSEFKKSIYINIREYYEKDGKALPGKKGISLTLEQYQSLIELIPSINAELGLVAGQALGDPSQSSLQAGKPQVSRVKSKSNIEATSDEDED